MKPARAILIIVILELVIILFALLSDGFTLEALQTTTRFSGRLSLMLFSIIFLFSNASEELTSYLSSKFFLVFAIAHGIHLLELLNYGYLSGNALNPVRALGGFIAYVMIFTMPFVQYLVDPAKIKQKKFVAIKTFSLYYIWFVFFMTYLPRVMGKMPNAGGNYWEFVILFIWVLLLLAIKLSGTVKRLSPAHKP